MSKFLFIATLSSTLFFYSCSSTSTDSTTSTTQFQVALSSSPAEGGSVSPADGEYEEGSTLEISASPNEGWRFDHWEGDHNSSNSTTEITVDTDKNITAVFEKKSYELTITTEGSGTVDEQVVQNKTSDYDHGTVVALTANAAEGWTFSEWSGALSGSENPKQITVDKAKEVTAVFEKKSYELTIDTQGEGSVNEDIIQAKSYDFGTRVQLTADPVEGWQFVKWQGDLTGLENPAKITVDNPKQVTAVFQKKTYPLTVNITGQGSIAKNPNQQEYEYGATVELTASPASGWDFKKWEGDTTGTDNPIQLTINSQKNVTALFAEQNQTLFYLAANGVTIKCENAQTGDSGTVNGIVYTKCNAAQITTSNAETTCTSGITAMDFMFNNASSFNGDISSWDVSSVTDMSYMFSNAYDFNTDISSWDVSSVEDMEDMFDGAESFNQSLNNWDVSSVTTMEGMFLEAESFDQNLDNWNVSNVINMFDMFYGATSFNGNIGSWDVSSVKDMEEMFDGAESFNQSLNNWDVSSVTNMADMFYHATSFNGDITDWDVSNVEDMEGMFMGAISFNQDLGDWDVGDVYFMDYMFKNATSFNQDISGWCVVEIDSQPYDFSTGSPLTNSQKPLWGLCP